MKQAKFLYYTTGSGYFPTDMLRYDNARAIDVIEIDGRTFHLIEGARPPTEGRWNSFLWSIIDTAEKRDRWRLPNPV